MALQVKLMIDKQQTYSLAELNFDLQNKIIFQKYYRYRSLIYIINERKKKMNCFTNNQEQEFKLNQGTKGKKRQSFPVYLANIQKLNILPSIFSQKNIVDKHKTDFGIFNKYKLEGFINFKEDSTPGEIINIVSVSSNALHAENKFIDLMHKYSNYQVAFVGFYGKKGCGKSLILDKMLNLLDFQGSHFCDNKEKSIKLWTTPLTKNNTKIFFIECSLPEQQNQNKQVKEEQMMLDLLLFLSSQIVLVTNPKDLQGNDFASLYKNIKKSSQRMIVQNKIIETNCNLWPKHCYMTFRDESSLFSQKFSKLQNLFNQTSKMMIYDAADKKYAKQYTNQDLKKISLSLYNQNKIFINQLYLRQIKVLVNRLFEQIKSKQFSNMRFIGSNVSCFFMNAVQDLNIKQRIDFDVLIKKSHKQLVVEGYNNTINWYHKKLQKQLKSEDPQKVDKLLEILQKTYLETFQVFKKNVDNPPKQYQKKLQNYIREKQKLVFEVNKKKSIKKLKKGMESIKIKDIPLSQIIEIRQVLFRTKAVERNLDSGRLDAIKQKLMEAWNKHKSIQDKLQVEEIQKLEDKISKKKVELQNLIKKNHDLQLKANTSKTKQKSFQLQSSQLQSKVQNLKFQVSAQKNKNKLALENSLQRIHRFAKTEEELTNNLKDYIERLNHQYVVKEKELKEMKQEMNEANELIKKSLVIDQKFQNNETSGINLKMNSKIEDQNFIVSEKLLNSRIAVKDQNVRLIKSRIDQKIKSQAQLQEVISNSYLNLQRPLTVYKNNIKRTAQKRNIKANSPIKIS